MLVYSMGPSADGYVMDRDGAFDWGAPDAEQFRFHVEQTRALGVHLLGRKLYETMQVWETDPSLRGTPDEAEFAEIWCALPKVVFSRTLNRVDGSNARLAEGSVAEEVRLALESTDKPVGIGGPTLAAEAIGLGLVDEFHVFRNPVVVGGGTPYFPAVEGRIELELLETRTFAGRVVFERYSRVRST